MPDVRVGVYVWGTSGGNRVKDVDGASEELGRLGVIWGGFRGAEELVRLLDYFSGDL